MYLYIHEHCFCYIHSYILSAYDYNIKVKWSFSWTLVNLQTLPHNTLDSSCMLNDWLLSGVKAKIYDSLLVLLQRGKTKEKEKPKDEVIHGFDESQTTDRGTSLISPWQRKINT